MQFVVEAATYATHNQRKTP